ncbi:MULTISPECIES: plasmid replication initiator TrfA [Commensalibacter]|uniref:Plasmid replication initiator protein-like protein n=2 Tax=Commensalibacter TaxID=1079922 RepID=W7E2Y5_9PROT|nr:MULTISPECIES: replication initiator protein A [Commensalibacter]EUK17416.1 plasmid replication initiator protein-like protein [Commensalibacter papalotli (ex Servin-Garciduenas et al. 2014)]CAI3957249.1 Plasmid replication initiator protein (RepA) [Commensalibacter papalotli (ex Botero et al. 2024)]CAI3957967.1 Plasmid replication initiator protein (RepA) [Commensalibacter papalotli (ex Botero et al. 2024)]
MEENTKDKSPLLPDRMQQEDFFICDIFDATPKGDMASMEHPIFSISTKPDLRIKHYENGKNFIKVIPSVQGVATVHDRDILIFCISQTIAALNNKSEIKQTLRFKAYDFLSATNRGTDGRGYEQLKAALTRLAGTRIETNITTGKYEILEGFGLIENYKIVRETREGRMQEIEIKLSDWVFNAIKAHEVLTLHRDYFRLRKPLERRMYELARKHCGQQYSWRIGLDKLQAKCGSGSTNKEFKRLVNKIIEQDNTYSHIPDYAVSLNGNNIIFTNRNFKELTNINVSIILNQETYHDAKLVAPGWDIYSLEKEWRCWMSEGGIDAPREPNKAFIGFCRKWFERHKQS